MIRRGSDLKSRRGFTLTEVMLAVAIASIAALLITSQFADLGQFVKSFLRGMDTQEDAVLFSGDIEFEFLRGRRITFTHFNTVDYGSADDAKKLGYAIFGHGKMVIESDLRPCDTFHPMTTPQNLSKITFICCGKHGEPQFEESHCEQDAGLSIETRGPNGSLRSQSCMPYYTQFAVSEVGVHFGRNTPLYYIDLLSKVGIASTGTMSVAGSARRLEIYEALGNAEASPVTFCEKSLPRRSSSP
jgi:prepilin-type N-terminal cleavage/methylation domain-containing protein